MLIQFNFEISSMEIERSNLPEQVILKRGEDAARQEIMDLVLKVAPVKKIKGMRPNYYGTSVCIISTEQFEKILGTLSRIKNNAVSKQIKSDCDMVLEQLKNVFSNEK